MNHQNAKHVVSIAKITIVPKNLVLVLWTLLVNYTKENLNPNILNLQPMKYIITAIIKDEQTQWEETFTVSYKVTEKEAFDYVCKIVNCFNSCLRPHETPRELVSIINVRHE